MWSKKQILILLFNLFFVCNLGYSVSNFRFEKVSAGEDHSMVLMEDKTLWSCGSNVLWQLGLGNDVSYTYALKQVKGENGGGFLQNVVSFDAGWKHSLAADVNGFIYAWGTDDYGQIGNGIYEGDKQFPDKVHGVGNVDYLTDIVYVSAGRSGIHSLAVDSNGYVYAWGGNNHGQCGNGDINVLVINTPVLVLDDDPYTSGVYLGDITHIIQADAGVYHSIALDVNGFVWHWGAGSSHESYPEKVKKLGDSYLTNIIQISCCGFTGGYNYSAAVDSSGNVWEWDHSDSAYKVPGEEMGTTYLENIVEVRAGGEYLLARTSSGRVLQWPFGESPVYVTDGEMNTSSGYLEGIVSIDSGYYDDKFAVCNNGFGWAWGEDNSSGQFGVGNKYTHPEPTRMLCPCVQPVSEIIYVDKSATGGNKDGTNWENAYTDLQKSLGSAIADCGSRIWVAKGTYNPTEDLSKTEVSFELINGVDLLGHFAGFETNPEQRDFANSSNETILDGLLGQEVYEAVQNVVRAEGISDSVINGFTIKGCYNEFLGTGAVYLDDSNISILNCIIKDNNSNGIYSSDSNLIVTDSILKNNKYSGLKFSTEYPKQRTLILKNSIIRNNLGNGVEMYGYCPATIINNWIYDNSGNGISIFSEFAAIIRNNTICGNSYGIARGWGEDRKY